MTRTFRPYEVASIINSSNKRAYQNAKIILLKKAHSEHRIAKWKRKLTVQIETSLLARLLLKIRLRIMYNHIVLTRGLPRNSQIQVMQHRLHLRNVLRIQYDGNDDDLHRWHNLLEREGDTNEFYRMYLSQIPVRWFKRVSLRCLHSRNFEVYASSFFFIFA